MLQRIYGTSFLKEKELEEYLKLLEEAKKRDHRKLGKDLDLFSFSEEAPGMPFYHPNGMVIRNELENLWRQEHEKAGYQEIKTPIIMNRRLWEQSGHWDHYHENMYFTKVDNVDYAIKPMNCPGAMLTYKTKLHSYRDLPVRLAEFGTVYRWEQSGELNGMTRVRGFTQDDAHIFCTPEQLGNEVQGCLELVKVVFATLGMKDYRVRVGLRDPDSSKFVGDPKNWDLAEEACRQAAATLGVPFSEEPGEAAFYGPKIDFVVKDVIGREWQLGTVQIDYVLPERFNLSYIGPDNEAHRPVMVHRAPFGSMERFTGVLIEHFAGNFPTWLAPEQVRLLTITDEQLPFAEAIQKKLKAARVRSSIDSHSDKFGAKIRRAEIDKVPYMFVIGKNEAAEGKVTIRSRVNKSHEGSASADEAIGKILQVIADRELPATE